MVSFGVGGWWEVHFVHPFLEDVHGRPVVGGVFAAHGTAFVRVEVCATQVCGGVVVGAVLFAHEAGLAVGEGHDGRDGAWKQGPG